MNDRRFPPHAGQTSYYDHYSSQRTRSDVVEWTCPEPPADDSYVVEELSQDDWDRFVARLRREGL